MQTIGDMETVLLPFTPDLERENILVADGAVEGYCHMLVIGNKGSGPIQLETGIVLKLWSHWTKLDQTTSHHYREPNWRTRRLLQVKPRH